MTPPEGFQRSLSMRLTVGDGWIAAPGKEGGPETRPVANGSFCNEL